MSSENPGRSLIVLNLEHPSYAQPLVRIPSTPRHTLRFVLQRGALDSCTALSTNYPTKDTFDRSRFHAVPFHYQDDCADAVADVDVNVPGAFEFRIVSGHISTESTHVLIEPALVVRGVALPNLDAVSLITVVPKWLGPFTNWPSHFKPLSSLGYNLVHFVPLQKRGISNSPYSIVDQLDLDPGLFKHVPNTVDERWRVLSKHVDTLHSEFSMLSMTDVVWNHTACNSPWLRDYPDSGYNLVNSPHLVPAYELDQAILDFSLSIYQGSTPLPSNPTTEIELDQLLQSFRKNQFSALKLWEYYIVDIEAALTSINDLWHGSSALNHVNPFLGIGLLPLPSRAQLLKQHAVREKPFGSRFPYSIDTTVCLQYLHTWISECSKGTDGNNSNPPTVDIKKELHAVLNEINLIFYRIYDDDVTAIFQNLSNTVRWQRLNPDGPKLGPITPETPLVWSYFTRGMTHSSHHAHDNEHFRPDLVWANNGWIWGANPLVDFAGPSSNVYMRREVIVWGDCVKLRFGQTRQDSPFLWDHMAEYTRLMAKHFHGFRIDNCHSTPLHVAQYLLDVARVERPDLYVIAELFTGSADVDRVFVAKLGINSLIREAMQAWDPRELSRVVHRYSGDAVGSFRTACQPALDCITRSNEAHGICNYEPHALFMDCTHDNEPPAQKRTVQDTVPNAAIVAMTCCASGSVMGIDWCIRENLNIVTEKRQYPVFSEDIGLFAFRRVLNHLHHRLSLENLSELYVYQEHDFVIVNRQDGRYHRGVIAIARTAFKPNPNPASINPVILKKTKVKLIAAQGIEPVDPKTKLERETLSDDMIPYIPVNLEDRSSYLQIHHDDSGNTTFVIDPGTPPGTVFLLDTWVTCVTQLSALHDLESEKGLDRITKLCTDLTLHDISVLLFQSDTEEQEFGMGVYDVPGHGALPYAGLEGIATVLRGIMRNNDLGSPVCKNIREGPWLMDYCVGRLLKAVESGRVSKAMGPLAHWMNQHFDHVKMCPSYLHPKYFSFVVMAVVYVASKTAFNKMGGFIANGSTFVKQLALTSLALTNSIPSASLVPNKSTESLAAGLPHFSSNHMRCWGRDIFISIKGLYLLTGQFEMAKSHIVAFASTMRHGLIPNLLDSGRYPRYNARDATWFWLQAVQDYCDLSPEGTGFLNHVVLRRFPTDTWIHWDDPAAYAEKATIAQVVIETLQRHALGIHFREWNAGPALDHAMKSDGFNVDAYIDWESGLVFGGNEFNCGTWMDKMGDSVKAGNAGFPATPRNGADVELQGLLASCLKWVCGLYKNGLIDASGVQASEPLNGLVLWTEWYSKVCKSFELYFYVPSVEDHARFVENGGRLDHPDLIQRRCIFKDVFGSSKNNYQFRPNQFIAMAVAPQLFTPLHARKALENGMEILLGPLGMCTLDPQDPEYRGNYDNSNDSNDRSVASGWNYHQGPEWLFPVGFFLRAYLHFALLEDPCQRTSILQTIHSRLLKHRAHIRNSVWAGLPELTNSKGSECRGSCPIQAWSSATLIELEHCMFQRNGKMSTLL